MKKNILLIDDFNNTLFVTGFTIEQAGYKATKALSAMEALKIASSDVEIDLVITDYNMPQMNGLEFIKELKKIKSRQLIPVFVLSTESKEQIKKACIEAGATAWIQKPFKSEKLIEYIKRAIG